MTNLPVLNVGIIGCGVIAPSHIKSYQALENVNVLWACDLEEERANARAEEFGIPKTGTDYRALLEDPDLHVVSICTDHASHAQIAAEALAAGKHVLCEKALASSREGLDQMAEAVKAHPEAVLSGILQHRFDRVYRLLREKIAAGVFGKVLYVTLNHFTHRSRGYYGSGAWRGTWKGEGGSLLINQSIHFLDTVQWIMGGVAEVAAKVDNLDHGETIETEDTAAISLRFKNGALGTITASTAVHKVWEPTLLIAGTSGFVELRDGKPLRVEFEDEEAAEALRLELEAAQQHGHVEGQKTYYGPSHPAQVEDFIEAIREKRAPYVGLAEAREPVALVLASYEASKTGKWVEVAE